MGKFVQENTGKKKKKDEINIFKNTVEMGEKGLGRKEKKDGGKNKSK
ncbi:MAG: hypothetical protein U0946_02275 [Patescibacteria group bacterium]|nr:hypothetical protein [Patescibacteria group bacterium]